MEAATSPSTRKAHWEHVHEGKVPAERSWFQPRPEVSLELILCCGISPEARVIDVGGGTSRLVDTLLDRGFRDLTVLDISSGALAEARERLGRRAGAVTWIESDITEAPIEGRYHLWHDRAVFHFLTDEAERAAYLKKLRGALAPGGHVIIATFDEHGPTSCSGLPVVRYSAQALAEELGKELELVTTRRELHRTPSGKGQSFVYCVFRKR